MATIKIYPPKTLPNEGVTDVTFSIWREELEVFLDLDERFQKFLPGGSYSTWEAEESFPGRITQLEPDDTNQANLPKYQRELRQFLTIIAKLIHPDYYNPILRHSTSLDWIYTRLRQDFDIQQKGIHFLNLIDLKWDPTAQTTPIGLYNNYRSLVMGNLGKTGDKIHWQNKVLSEDEKLTPSHEDLIFLNVLMLLHPKLPAYVKDQYAFKIGNTGRLMDFKTEILNKAKSFIEEIESLEQPASNMIYNNQENDSPDPSCNYMNARRQNYRSRPRGSFRPSRPFRQQQQQPTTSQQQPSRQFQQSLPPFCRLCQLSNQPRHIYTSHYIGEESCPSMSSKDKAHLIERTTSQLSNLQIEEPDLEAEYGYDSFEPESNNQVNLKQSIIPSETTENIHNNISHAFSDQQPAINIINPVPTQTFTATDSNGTNLHLDLDSGATVSYAKLSAVQKHNFQIKPNSQLSSLADGKTKMPSVGEIDEVLTRNNFKVRLHAIVTKDLHCDFIAGTNFLKENNVIQDIANRSITIHKKYTVPETNKMLILPTSSNIILKNNNVNVVLPGRTVQYPVPYPDQETVAVEPCFQNKNNNWPSPQLCKVSNGFISVQNYSNDIISLKNGNDKVQVRTFVENKFVEAKCLSTSISNPVLNEKYKNIQINSEGIDSKVVSFIKQINEKYSDVFNEDLTEGYNMHFGKHVCHLNWAGDSRPPASKVHSINYDHDTKVLLQQVCDQLTHAGVLGIPQSNNVKIQHVSPAFLVRKQKAKNKNKNELTTKDVRLVINFGVLNEYLKNFPTPVTKTKDIFLHLGRWKHIIVMDLFQGFFQNHSAPEDAPWLGISTPFGGLRYVRRSGQGLLGQSEELDEMLSKVLSSEMQNGICARIADDLYVGGSSPLETAQNYEIILSKLNAANLKISSEKTKIFLDSVDILGWVWTKGGFLKPSPHRINSLKNTTVNDIKTIKDLRSWLGLYKTMMNATPNLTLILDPFDKIVSDKASNDEVQWDESLKISFNKAKEAIDTMQTLYLPSPQDQLLLVVDAAKSPPGLGHTLYAVKDKTKLPVSFHSNKLSDTHAKWHSCELEALAFATAITAEYHILKESKKPIIVAPDSKAVADAVNMIKRGKHSSNPRIQALITNVNRIPLIVQLASGKNNLNKCGDHQSRFPSSCQAQHCSICNFVQDSTDNTLHPFAINAINPTEMPHILDNKIAWLQVQDADKACQQAKFCITSGKTPSKQSGKLLSEVRRLTSVATVNSQGLLIVKAKPNAFSSIGNEQIVIPSTHLPAVLWQLHSTLNHPPKSQLKSQFEKSFYSVGLHPELDKLYYNCHFCASQMKIPSVVPHHTKTDTKVPGTHFHADVIKRKCQNILTIRDNFSAFTVAKIIKSENNKDLKEGLIDLLTPIKLAGEINVKVDNCPGFKPLLNDKDHDLNKLGIHIENTDVFNKNANACVDKACYELQQELIRIEPDGRPVSNTTIQYAIQLLNRKLRRNGTITAYEIYFNRDILTGDNLNLNFEKLKSQQFNNRTIHNEKHNLSVKNDISDPKPGDIVIPKGWKPDKHKAKDLFIVTASQNDKIKIQKIIHSYSEKPCLRSKSYTTDKSRLHVTRSQSNLLKKAQHKATSSTPLWNPIQDLHNTSSDDEYYVIPPVRVTAKKSTVTASSPIAESASPSNRSSSSSAYTSVQNSPKSNERPQVYQELDQWLYNQRKYAAEQLNEAIALDISQSEEEEDELNHTILSDNNQEIDKRALIKSIAKDKISAIYHKRLPQLDGALTDPSPDISPNNSPDSKPIKSSSRPISRPISRQKNLAPARCELEYVAANTFDYTWDHSADIDITPFPAIDPCDIFENPVPDGLPFLKRSGSSHL